MRGTLSCFYELGQRPQIVERIRNEIKELDLLNENATTATFDKSVVLDAFIKEVLRHYPPGPFSIERKALVDFQLGKYSVKKGDLLTVPFSTLQTVNGDPSRSDPFDIEKFIDKEQGKNQLFLTFAIGKRGCTGRYLGESLMKAIISYLIASTDVVTDLAKYPATLVLEDNYGLDRCILKCSSRAQPLS